MKTLTPYFGGKANNVGTWITNQLPMHRCYVEPFGGMCGVLMKKAPSANEVYNDLNETIVNLFRVLRNDEKRTRLREQLMLTPHSKREFYECAGLVRRVGKGEIMIDDVELARAAYVVLSQSWEGSILGKGYGYSGPNKTSVAKTFAKRQENIEPIAARLRTVQLECDDAVRVITRWDSESTLFYVDPPYTIDERTCAGYAKEMDQNGHRMLLETLKGLSGMVLLSGYPNPLYESELEANGWERRNFATVAHASFSGNHGGKKASRIESLWLNSAAQAAPTLFQ